MSTRGTAYFEIQYALDKDPVRVGKICISHDAYPSWFGEEVCKLIQSAYILVDSDVGSADLPIGDYFPNVERVILHVLFSMVSDIFEEREYVYKFTFKPFENTDPICQAGKIYTCAVENRCISPDTLQR